MHVCYHLTGFVGEAQAWERETLSSIGMLLGGNSAPAFTAPLHAKKF